MPGFTGYDDLIAEMTAGKRLILPWAKSSTTAVATALRWYHLWPVGGQPGAGALYTGTALQFQRTTDLTAGALYHGGNKSADTKHIVAASAQSSAGAISPMLWLLDMVGYYPLTQSASPQNFDNTNAPDRYVSAGQSGLQPVLVAGAAGGATASNITVLTYVNQDGATGHLMPTTPAVPVTVSAVLPTATLPALVLTNIAGPFLPLQAGDCGMRSLTNITFSAANTGLEAILLVKVLAKLQTPSAGVFVERDLVMQLANLERIYDGACLTWLVHFGSATGSTFVGDVEVAWG